MRVQILSLTENLTILSGAQSGRNVFAKLIAVAAASQSSDPEPVFLDFEGVTVATASFLRESVLAFRDYARSTIPTLYPVVANASASVLEELEFFLRHRKDAVWVCRLDTHEVISEPRLLGELDEAHRATFDMVVKLGMGSAPVLAAQSGSSAPVSPTAWNNRLALLAARGLLIEQRSGKTKNFVPVLEVA